MSRCLFVMHHILSQTKISFIKSASKQAGLSGIIKTGYPGVLLLSGSSDRKGMSSLQKTLGIQQSNSKVTDGKEEVVSLVKKIKSLRWQTCTLLSLQEAPNLSSSSSSSSSMAFDLLSIALAQTCSQSAETEPVNPGLIHLEEMKEITAVLKSVDARAETLLKRLSTGGQSSKTLGSIDVQEINRSLQSMSWEKWYSEVMRHR